LSPADNSNDEDDDDDGDDRERWLCRVVLCPLSILVLVWSEMILFVVEIDASDDSGTFKERDWPWTMNNERTRNATSSSLVGKTE